MSSSGSDYYEYGSTARKVRYDVYKENPVLKNRIRKIKYTKVKMRIILLMLFVFACGMTLMYRYAQITDLNYRIDESKRNYNSLKNENITLKVKIDNSLDMSNVRQFAETKFGMHKPQKEQMVTVSVPKSDYIKTNDAEINRNAKSNTSFLAGFTKLVRNLGLIK